MEIKTSGFVLWVKSLVFLFCEIFGDCESAKTRVDREEKLAELIKQLKAEIAEMKKATKNA